MSDLSKIQVNNVTYNVKDEQARNIINSGNIGQILKTTNNGVEWKTYQLVFNDISIPASSWMEQMTPNYEDYPFITSISLNNVTINDYAEVVFNVSDASSSKFAPINETYNGGIYLYRSSVPDFNIIIPTIVIFKQ